jgi:hypothetical protein
MASVSSFDLRPYVTDSAADGQLYVAEGIFPEAYYDCTLACLRDSARDYGFGTPYDAHQLRQFCEPGSSSGLTWADSVKAAQTAYPGLAQVMRDNEAPGDVVSAIRAAGAQGFMVHCGFWCDTNAWVPAQGPVTYSHACRLLAGDGAGTTWQNPEPHPDFYLTDAQVRSLWDGGGLLIFQRSLLPTVPSPLASSDS